jgi:hypothetical protein
MNNYISELYGKCFLAVKMFFEKLSCRTKPTYDELYDDENIDIPQKMYR